MPIDTRIEDLEKLSSPIFVHNNIALYHELRFFEGDGPAAQFETGQQKGGKQCIVFSSGI